MCNCEDWPGLGKLIRMARRFDVGEMRKPEKLPSGFLRADAYITKTGVFTYAKPGGGTQRELRHPDDVMAPASLASLAMVPLTLGHPPEGRVDAATAKKHSVGSVGENVVVEGQRVRSTLMVTDAAAVAAVLAGTSAGLSGGYECSLEAAPGTFEGQPYDFRQRDIVYNHAALTDRPRLGTDMAVKLDSDDAVQVDAPTTTREDSTMLKKIRIDGVDYEATEQAVQAFTAWMAKADVAEKASAAELATTKADLAKATARADSLDEKLKVEVKARADATDPAAMTKAVKARVALEGQATKVLGAEVKLDAMSDLDIKRAVVLKVSPKAPLEGKDALYIEARYDQAIEDAGTGDASDSLAAARRAAAATHGDGTVVVVDSEKARDAMIKRNAELAKAPLSTTKSA